MKQVIKIICCLLLVASIYTSCKKTAVIETTGGDNVVTTNLFKEQNPLVIDFFNKTADAKKFFTEKIFRQKLLMGNPKSNTMLKARQQINKTALWDQAYIAQTKTKGDVVIVPLQYDKPLQMLTSFGNGRKQSMEAQTHLWIYKDALNNYTAEVVTVLPTKKYQETGREKFSGYVLIEDWAGNNLRTVKYEEAKPQTIKKNGKNTIGISPNPSASAARTICTFIDWYLCDVGNYGNYSNCVFLNSEFIECHDNHEEEEIDYIDGGNGSGGGGSDDDYVATSKFTLTKLWVVGEDDYALVLSPEVISGVKSFANTSILYNHFTSIAAGHSYITNKLYYTIKIGNNINAYPTTSSYSEDAHGVSYDILSVGATASGHYQQQNVSFGTTTPIGEPHTITKANAISWGFLEIFP